MKKIISLLVVVMMLASFSITSFAAEVTLSLSAPEVAVGTETAVVDITINLADVTELGMFQFCFTLPAGVTLSGYDATAVTSLFDTTPYNDDNLASGQILIYEDDTTTGIPAGTDSLTIPVTFAIADASVATVYDITMDADNTMVSDIEGNPLNADVPSTTITVKAEETVNTVDFADVENNRVVVTSDAAATDWQIGSGVAITVKAAEVPFTKMIWALTIDGVRKFSEPVKFDIPTTAGNLQFAATFINGGHNDKFAVDAPAPAEISDVDAIFADEADVEYFTNATDAKPEYRR